MRICFIAMGKFTHIGAYLDFFSKAGHDVHFVALAPGPERGVPTYDVDPFGSRLKIEWKGRYLLAMLKARPIVRKLRPDIVHAHYATSAGLAAFVCGVHPYIVTAHGTDVTRGVRSRVWKPVLRRIFSDADCVNPVSDELTKLVLDLAIPAENVETLTLGIDTQRFAFQSPRPNSLGSPLKLVCTRRLEEVYDHRTMINAMGILAKRRVAFSLTLVGDGPLRESLQKLAAEQGVKDRVTFAGTVPNSQLPGLLSKQNVYLSASLRDGASLSLLEGMASGLYPIVTDIPANSQWIKHGRNGLLHKPADAQNLAECLSAFSQDTGQKDEALSFNRNLVVTKGDRSTNMRRLEAIYCNLKMKTNSIQNLRRKEAAKN